MPTEGIIFSCVLGVPIVLTAIATVIITSRLNTHGSGGSPGGKSL